MSAIQQLITEHLDIWTAADAGPKSGRGRSSTNATKVYGISKLRELILELAVRGRLVPQDSGDEPASELLKRIQVKKTKLIAEGKIKKDKPLAPIAEEEQPFAPPAGWEWVRLGEISEIVRGVTYGKSDASDSHLPDYVPLLRGNNIDRVLNFDRPVFVPKKLLNEGQYVKAGDIVIAMSSGSADLVGKAAQAAEDFNGGFGAFCGVIRSVSDDIFSFFGFFFQTPLYRSRAAGHGKGIGINNLQKTVLQTLEIPLPPLAEQHRIVAKVDELMALCDQLESEHNNATEAHEKLVSHLLGTLTQSQSAEDFSDNWQRIATHFDTLFTTEASVDALKQTLLQLAVMGKLVPQDPNDEPASELLKRIQAKKESLIAEGKIKKDKPLPPITGEAKPFELPVGWEWMRLGSIGYTQTGTTPSKSSAESFGSDIPFIKPGDIYPNHIDYCNEGLSFLGAEQSGRVALAGSLLMVCIGTIGKCNLIERDCSFNQQINSVTPYLFDSCYLLSVCRSPYFNAEAWTRSSSTTIAILNKGKWEEICIPVPPLTEQRRIVAKVDELMTLCDQLKSRLTEVRQLQQKLSDVLVEKAVV